MQTATVPGGNAIPSDAEMVKRDRSKSSGLRLLLMVLLRVVILVAFLVGWEVIVRIKEAEFWVSRPTLIWEQLQSWNERGILWSATWVTLQETVYGFVLGAVAGAIIGFVFGWFRGLGDLFHPFIVSLYTMPKIAIAPLFVLWFGIGMFNKVMMAAFLVFFLVFFTTFQGVRSVDRELVDVTRVMGANTFQTLRKIGVPHALVWVFSGLRIALPYALIGAVVAEFIAARDGLGFLIKTSSQLLNPDGVFAGLAVLMVISISLYTLLGLVESRVMRWRDS